MNRNLNSKKLNTTIECYLLNKKYVKRIKLTITSPCLISKGPPGTSYKSYKKEKDISIKTLRHIAYLIFFRYCHISIYIITTSCSRLLLARLQGKTNIWIVVGHPIIQKNGFEIPLSGLTPPHFVHVLGQNLILIGICYRYMCVQWFNWGLCIPVKISNVLSFKYLYTKKKVKHPLIY